MLLDPFSKRINVSHQKVNIDGLVQDCSNSSVLAMELLQSCIKPSICDIWYISDVVPKWN